MLTAPDRLSEARDAMGRGEQVDWRKLADLQALDLAIIGRQFVENAIAYQDQALNELEQMIKGQQ